MLLGEDIATLLYVCFPLPPLSCYILGSFLDKKAENPPLKKNTDRPADKEKKKEAMLNVFLRLVIAFHLRGES